MITISTHQGKHVEIVLERELCHPVDLGEHVRAYCHIHGSDHQRSLSINKMTGWGHCFNAACEATVLVVEWNRAVAKRLLHFHYQGLSSAALPSYHPPFMQSRRPRPYVVQPMLLPPPKAIPVWQQDELHTLRALDEQMRQTLAHSQRAQMYLRERGIPLKTALATGVGYVPATLLNGPEMRKQRGLLRRWADRLLFPLNSLDGRGYIGRSLWHWQPGMNETIHKALLERPGSPKRWIKTSPAGWFGVDTVVLALDGDDGGKEASSRLADQLVQAGLRVQVSPVAQDTCGKDWNERWQHLGQQSLAPVFEAFAQAHST